MLRTKRRYLISCLGVLAALLLFASGAPVGAQLPTPLPSLSPLEPEPSPSPSPSPSEQPPQEPPPSGGGGGGGGGGGNSGGGGGSATQPPASSAPAPTSPTVVPGFPLEIPQIARTRSRNTNKLIEILAPLTERGMPLEQAMVLAAPPFPVAGTVWYSDDWLFPRMGPPPHLHEGTDIFAPMGTPIVASSPGVIAGKGETALGGTSLWVSGDDGTGYYYTHLSAYADGIELGSRVVGGAVIGYVGNSGNAITTPAHLHFEIHPPIKNRKGNILAGGVTTLPDGTGRTNTPPVNPKPILDAWLFEAEAKAQQVVLQMMERFSHISRQLHFAGRIEQFYSSEVSGNPRELFWFSVFDPTLAAMGMVKQASVEMTLGSSVGSVSFSQAEEARLSAVRLAVQSPKLKLAALTGDIKEHSEQ